MNTKPGTKEGEICNRGGCPGIMEFKEVENCMCHIRPPCNACVDNLFRCDTCGETEGDDQ